MIHARIGALAASEYLGEDEGAAALAGRGTLGRRPVFTESLPAPVGKWPVHPD